MVDRTYAGIGSRTTPETICNLMARIALYLDGQGYTLRSGHASGADQAFEAGAGSAKEIFIPWSGFNGSNSDLLPVPAAFKMAEEFHPGWKFLNQGMKKLHARNCHQVLGYSLDDPVEFVLCWTHDGTAKGGTGQALRLAEAHKIPIYNLYHVGVRHYWRTLAGIEAECEELEDQKHG